MSKYKPTHWGVGYIGEGEYKTWCDGKHTPAYSTWKGILKRCYDNKLPAYSNVTVHTAWHNFQNFAKWYEINFKEGYQIDKDLLSPTNKQYGASTCVYLPRHINNLLVIYPASKSGLPKGIEKRGDSYRVKVANKSVGTCKSLDDAIDLRNTKQLDHVEKVLEQSVALNEITRLIADKIIDKLKENK